jgi:hypothetical protein
LEIVANGPFSNISNRRYSEGRLKSESKSRTNLPRKVKLDGGSYRSPTMQELTSTSSSAVHSKFSSSVTVGRLSPAIQTQAAQSVISYTGTGPAATSAPAHPSGAFPNLATMSGPSPSSVPEINASGNLTKLTNQPIK